MDIIDHLIYTACTDKVRPGSPIITSDFIGAPFSSGIEVLPGEPRPELPKLSNQNETYSNQFRQDFVSYEDSVVLEKAIQKHWYDMIHGPISAFEMFKPKDAPPYHLIYAYLIENSRLSQIMERLIYLYRHDEELGIASAQDPSHNQAFLWIQNTENLFFKTLSNTNYRNITGNLRPNPEGSRRNAYFRMFGMDLAFGEPTEGSSIDYSYIKAKSANKDFIFLFEQFLSELWQGYINAQNTSGANSTDYQRIIDMATKLRQMLMARRGSTGNIQLSTYQYMNLSREEYASVVMMSWMFYIISYDSPLVSFLGCQANTSSERLANIGKKVGIASHKRTQSLFDMAAPMATILRNIEFGTFEISAPDLWIRRVIESSTASGSLAASAAQKAALVDILMVVNNWEKSTGHRIKNPETNITGSVKILPNGTKKQMGMN
ncbi:hypothetical protein [Rhodonellum sp.]|uniref:hypothetical protein n=1 Tax=Rhodonellum sp. TaxID=2231180 RepID=UPI00271BBB4F|nr:hypothetical protein [Rhodonellum sp.]MDO9551418.1 hypothetical protein [Rhodonellum sp.]